MSEIREEVGRKPRKDMAEHLVEALGGECWNCGSKGNLEIHHILPLKDGGADSLSNLSVLCEYCHGSETRGKTYAGSQLQRQLLIIQGSVRPVRIKIARSFAKLRVTVLEE